MTTVLAKDRAEVVASAVLAIIARQLRSADLYRELVAALREEFHDIEQTTLREARPDGTPD